MNAFRETFERECKPRFGRANPERMRLPYWEWMVRSMENPFSVRERLGLPQNFPACARSEVEGATCGMRPEPDWCFDRFGATRTSLPDGRILCVGGEHEDWYDPDFCIYNDLVVKRPTPGATDVTKDEGEVEIYGYPEEVFPPTDFHTATLVADRVLLVGRLGYAEGRDPKSTPIYALDTTSYAIEGLSASGPCPGWIYKHHASYEAGRHALLVRGGRSLDHSRHTDVHRLHLADRRWELVARNERHRGFTLHTKHVGNPTWEATIDELRPRRVPHTPLPPDGREVMRYAIDVQGARFTFLELYTTIKVLLEGELPEEVVQAVFDDVRAQLAKGSGSPWLVEEREIEEAE